jgi:DNA-binding CsgD family transcriptional regulator
MNPGDRTSELGLLVNVLRHAGYMIVADAAGKHNLGIARTESPDVIIAQLPTPTDGRNEEAARREEFRLLNDKLLDEVDELREAVILAGLLYQRVQRTGAHAMSTAREVLPPTPSAEDLLSRRELQVLDMIAAGAQNSEIAECLVIAPTTVQSHVQHILRKLSARNRTEAAARYLRH